MPKNKLVAPVLKWVGGKRQLLPSIKPLLPKKITSYCEPFVGGGAVLFELQPKRAMINDINSDLILVYTVIRDSVEELIELLETYPNDEKFYYELRNIDRNQVKYVGLSDIERAARVIFLNKTCFNGLYRVNSKGLFDVPIGAYKNPPVCDTENLRVISGLLQNVEIQCGDYSKCEGFINKKSFNKLAA